MIIHGHPLSPPSLLAWSVAEYVGATFEKKVVDLMKGEHHSEEYKKLNPNSLVPTLQEGDFALFESFAIARFLVNSRNKNGDHTIYPADDLKIRSQIDQHIGHINDWRYSGL